MRIRRMIFTILQPDDGDSALSRIFDWLVTALILTSVVIVFAATFNLPSGTMRVLSAIEAVASVVFTIEYALRIITADFLYQDKGPVSSRIKYIFSPMALVDFVAILPFWLPMFLPETLLGLRALRLVRLLRILKLHRYYDAMRSLGEVVVLKKRELLGSIYFVAILMLLASLLMRCAARRFSQRFLRLVVGGGDADYRRVWRHIPRNGCRTFSRRVDSIFWYCRRSYTNRHNHDRSG